MAQWSRILCHYQPFQARLDVSRFFADYFDIPFAVLDILHTFSSFCFMSFFLDNHGLCNSASAVYWGLSIGKAKSGPIQHRHQSVDRQKICRR